MRWTGRAPDQIFETNIADALAAMDEAGIDIALLSAWHGPEGSLISNEEVAAQIEAAPSRSANCVGSPQLLLSVIGEKMLAVM